MNNYFTFKEMINSYTAATKGINNTPTNKEIIDNIYYTIDRLNEIRDFYGKPIIITSGYRCPQLNQIIGGKLNSKHLLGLAADIKWNEQLLSTIKDKFHFDQLIEESNKNTKWIHISFFKDKSKERNQYLTLYK